MGSALKCQLGAGGGNCLSAENKQGIIFSGVVVGIALNVRMEPPEMPEILEPSEEAYGLATSVAFTAGLVSLRQGEDWILLTPREIKALRVWLDNTLGAA